MSAVIQPPKRVVPSPPWPVSLDGIPIMYEDEDDMGEAINHYWAIHVSFACLTAFLREYRPELRVFANLNCYYLDGPADPISKSLPYFSADLMIVRPNLPCPDDLASYTIGQDGPAPILALEVLSNRTYRMRDLGAKLQLYSKLGINEYILVDTTSRFMPERILLKRLQSDRTWKDFTDRDNGVTSELGFRIAEDGTGDLAILDAWTGKRYPRPMEAQAEAEARAKADERRLQAEEARRQTEVALRRAEERAEEEAAARRQAEERAKAESTARSQAEERARAEAVARSQAEERIRSLEEELNRLRQPPT